MPAGLLRLAEFSGMEVSGLEQKLQGRMEIIVGLYAVVFLVGLALLIAFNLRIQKSPLAWDEPVRRLVWRPWDGTAAAWVILPLLAIQIVFALLYTWLDRYFPDAETGPGLLILQSLLFHWAGLLLIAVSLGVRRLNATAAFGLPGTRFMEEAGWGLLILLGIMPMIIGYNVVSQMVMDWLGYVPPLQDVTRIISDTSGWTARLYLALLALVVAPIVEEMLFRGILLPALARVTGVKPAVVIVSALFALIHGHLPSVVPLFILSCALCLAYIYRGTLVTSVAMHAFFNSLTMAVLLWP